MSIIALYCSVWTVCGFQLTHAYSHQIKYVFIKFNVSTFFTTNIDINLKLKITLQKNKIKKNVLLLLALWSKSEFVFYVAWKDQFKWTSFLVHLRHAYLTFDQDA